AAGGSAPGSTARSDSARSSAGSRSCSSSASRGSSSRWSASTWAGSSATSPAARCTRSTASSAELALRAHVLVPLVLRAGAVAGEEEARLDLLVHQLQAELAEVRRRRSALRAPAVPDQQPPSRTEDGRTRPRERDTR